jgi:hypothetical protein
MSDSDLEADFGFGLQLFVCCWLYFHTALALRKSRLIGFDFAALCIKGGPTKLVGPPKNFEKSFGARLVARFFAARPSVEASSMSK